MKLNMFDLIINNKANDLINILTYKDDNEDWEFFNNMEYISTIEMLCDGVCINKYNHKSINIDDVDNSGFKYGTFFIGKNVDYYLSYFKKFYGTKINDIDGYRGLQILKNKFDRCVRTEYMTRSKLIHKRFIADRELNEELKNVEIAYNTLKEQGYTDKMTHKIYFESLLRQPGIYEIVNIKNNKRYIGMAHDVKDRWSSHKVMLNAGEHHCKNLQDEWNEFGVENFRFNVIEVLDTRERKELRFKEKYWFYHTIGDKYNSEKNMMNKMEYENELLKRRVEELEKALSSIA